MRTPLPSPRISSRSLSPSRPLSPSEAAAIDFTHPTDHLLTPPLSPISRTAKYHIVMRGGDRYERGADLLSPLETFEHYENRARSPQSVSGQWGSEQIPQPPTRYTSNRSTRQTQGYNQGVRSAISHRSPTYPQPAQSSNGPIAAEYRAQQQSYAIPQTAQAPRSYDTRPSTLACEYRADPRLTEPLRPLVTDYRPSGNDNGRPQGNLACEYRVRDVSPSVRTVTTSYQPRLKDKLPLKWIVCMAVGIPAFIIICMLGAVQLQELGIL